MALTLLGVGLYAIKDEVSTIGFTDYIQERVASLGVANPLSFVVALVGVQGLIEIIVGCAVGGVLARAVASFLGHRAPAKAE